MRVNSVPDWNISYCRAAHLVYLLAVDVYQDLVVRDTWLEMAGPPNDAQLLCGPCCANALQRFTTGMRQSRPEPMALSQPGHLRDIIHVKINSEAGIFKSALQRQHHGLGHAGIGKSGAYIKV